LERHGDINGYFAGTLRVEGLPLPKKVCQIPLPLEEGEHFYCAKTGNISIAS
jgi:hypothetical protein